MTIEKQILIGYYKTVEAFDADMLKVFRNAEVVFTNLRHRFPEFVLKSERTLGKGCIPYMLEDSVQSPALHILQHC